MKIKTNMNELEQLKKEIADLKAWKASLERSSTIPLSIDQAFRARFELVSLSTIGATSHNKTVDEAGSATYSVMDKPDLFVQVKVGTSIYYIPVFTS
jgi:hypothetical protein